MKDISGYLVNPFNDPHISLPALFSFTTDHLERMKANNPGGLWDARIAATSSAWIAYGNSDVTDMTKLGVRKGDKRSKRNFRKAMRERLARVYGAMLGHYGVRSPEIKAVFGKSRGRMARTVDDLLKEELTVVSEGVTARAADLGASIVTEAQNLLSEWTVIWQASESATGVKSAAEAAKRSARRALQTELFLNLLFIAQQFPGQPEKLKLYMQKSLLRVGRKS
jgi:hypothetical protein